MNGPQVAGYLVALGVGAVILEVVRSLLNRRQMGANAAKIITDTALDLLTPLQQRVHELEAVVNATQDRLVETQEKLSVTQSRLTEAHRTLEATVERLEKATAELEHLRLRVVEREDIMDAREERDEAREARMTEDDSSS